jgi:hypothetical protein
MYVYLRLEVCPYVYLLLLGHYHRGGQLACGGQTVIDLSYVYKRHICCMKICLKDRIWDRVLERDMTYKAEHVWAVRQC